MNNKFYMFATIFLLLIIGAFFFSGIFSKEQITSQSSKTEDLGDYQKAVLGMKNYNYYPDVIEVQQGKPVRLYIDNSVQGCYRSLVIPGFNIRKTLTPNQDYVEFTPTEAGTYNFACSMGMGKGKIIVN